MIHVHKTIQISQRWFFEKHICIYKYFVIHNFHYKFLEILYIGIDLFFHPTWLLGSKYKISHLLPTRQEADSKLKAVTGTSSKSGRRPSKGSFGVGSVIFGVDGFLGIPLKTKQTWLTKRGEERWSNNMFPKMHTNNGWFLFMLLNLEGGGWLSLMFEGQFSSWDSLGYEISNSSGKTAPCHHLDSAGWSIV